MKLRILFLLLGVLGLNSLEGQVTPNSEEEKTSVVKTVEKELPPPVEIRGEIFKAVTEMPRFYSEECEKLTSKDEKEQCAKSAMNEFIANNLQYPEIAKENGLEGKVVMRFVIATDGSLQEINILRNIGGGAGREAMRLIGSMPRFVPGKQRGRLTPVYYNLSIPFSLQEEHKKMNTQVKQNNDEPVFIDQMIGDMPIKKASPPPAPQTYKGEVFKMVDEMPRFPSEKCESISSKKEKKQCSQMAKARYISKNLPSPSIAKQNKVQGTTVTRFIVNKNGSISDITVIRSIGGGTDEELIDLVKSMPNWIPGKQNGELVRTYEHLTVKFKL